ncbi:hypothetical protein [Rhodococcus sp. SJ-2]
MSRAEPTVAVDLSTPAVPADSTALMPRTGASRAVRIRASDLREAQKACARIRAEFEETGDPGVRVDVLLDVVVHIAPDARTARTEARWQPSAVGAAGEHTVVYVGTPRGLASLILDIRAAEVADGVTLIPSAAEGDSREMCVKLLKSEVLAVLEARRMMSDGPLRQQAG